MFEHIPKSLAVVAACLCTCGGTLSFNHFVETGQSQALWLGLALYMTSNVFYLSVLHASGLAFAAVVCGVLSIVFLTLYGVFSKGSITPPQVAGLAFAVLAIILFNLPKSEV